MIHASVELVNAMVGIAPPWCDGELGTFGYKTRACDGTHDSHDVVWVATVPLVNKNGAGEDVRTVGCPRCILLMVNARSSRPARKLELHIVRGTSGEYSDRSDWPVAACLTAESAAVLEAACIAFAKEHTFGRNDYGRGRERVDTRMDYDEEDKLKQQCRSGEIPCPDPKWQTDYTGTDYYTEVLPVQFTRDEMTIFMDSAITVLEQQK